MILGRWGKLFPTTTDMKMERRHDPRKIGASIEVQPASGSRRTDLEDLVEDFLRSQAKLKGTGTWVKFFFFLFHNSLIFVES